MKVVMTFVVVAVMLVVSSVYSDQTETGLFGCRLPESNRFNLNILAAGMLAGRNCNAENTLELCMARTQDCISELGKINDPLDQDSYTELRQHLEDCSECIDNDISMDEIPHNLEELDGHCPSLDDLAKVGFNFWNAFPFYKCLAKKVDPEGLQKFVACVNGESYSRGNPVQYNH